MLREPLHPPPPRCLPLSLSLFFIPFPADRPPVCPRGSAKSSYLSWQGGSCWTSGWKWATATHSGVINPVLQGPQPRSCSAFSVLSDCFNEENRVPRWKKGVYLVGEKPGWAGSMTFCGCSSHQKRGFSARTDVLIGISPMWKRRQFAVLFSPSRRAALPSNV